MHFWNSNWSRIRLILEQNNNNLDFILSQKMFKKLWRTNHHRLRCQRNLKVLITHRLQVMWDQNKKKLRQNTTTLWIRRLIRLIILELVHKRSQLSLTIKHSKVSSLKKTRRLSQIRARTKGKTKLTRSIIDVNRVQIHILALKVKIKLFTPTKFNNLRKRVKTITVVMKREIHAGRAIKMKHLQSQEDPIKNHKIEYLNTKRIEETDMIIHHPRKGLKATTNKEIKPMATTLIL